jgi:hypothetical protein
MDEAAEAWYTAFKLADHIRAGGRPVPAPPTVALRPGEVQYGSPVLEYLSFYGMDVEYESHTAVSGGLLFTAVGMAASAASNAAARNRAERMARPQWRPLGVWPAVVTNRRLLTMVQYRWSSWSLDEIIGIQLDLPHRVLVLTFEGAPPLMLRGPWAPWTGVVLSASTSGQPWPPGTVLPPAVTHRPVTGAPPTRMALPPGPDGWPTH